MPSSPRSPGSPVESHHCSSPVTVPANDLGKPASCVVEEPRPHLVMSRPEGRPVVRSSEQLRLHRALEELGWIGLLDEFNDAARLTNPFVTEPILITTNGTILAGFGRWRAAVLNGGHEINCIEYPLSDDEALQFIIRHHQSQQRMECVYPYSPGANTGTLFSAKGARKHARRGEVQGFGNFAGSSAH